MTDENKGHTQLQPAAATGPAVRAHPSPHQPLTANPLYFCLAAIVLASVLAALLLLLGAPLIGWVDVQTARVFGHVARLTGSTVTVSGAFIQLRFGEQTRMFVIGYGCDGVLAFLLLASAIVPFPCSLRARIVGLVTGLLFVLLMNQARLCLLVLVMFLIRDPASFAFYHWWGGQAFAISLIFAFWIFWASRVLKSASRSAPVPEAKAATACPTNEPTATR